MAARGPRRVLAVCVTLAAVTATSGAFARNPRSVPIGGRTATMGGAGTAAGNDSAMPYLNPAGLGGVPGDVFAVSATIYGYTQRTFEDFFFPNGRTDQLGPWNTRNDTIESQSVMELPSSVMYFTHLSAPEDDLQHKLGFALVIPTADRLELIAMHDATIPNIAGTASQSQTMIRRNTDYYVGPSYAVELDDAARLGASLFLHYYRSVETGEYSDSYTAVGGSTAFSLRGVTSSKAEAVGLAPIVGGQVNFLGSFWLGAAVAAPTLHLTGRRTFSAAVSNLGTDPATFEPYSRTDGTSFDGDYQAVRPMRLNAGIAWDDRESFSFAADLQYYAARNPTGRSKGTSTTSQQKNGWLARSYQETIEVESKAEPILDVSVGMELVVTQLVALRAGGFTDFADTAPLNHPDASDMYSLRIDRFGGTVGLGLRFGSFDSTIGGVAVFGKGKYVVPDTFSDEALATGTKYEAIDATERTFLFVLSGTVTTEEAKKTIRDTVPISIEPPDLSGPSGPSALHGQPATGSGVDHE